MLQSPGGGRSAASLSIMVGGSQAVFEKILPILQLMGKNITRLVGMEMVKPQK
jgi:2-hydroxy-3-oxopropionate reductase